MLTVRESVHIASSPDDVFAFLDKPARQTSFTPHLTESTEIERLDNGGARARYRYDLYGWALSGEVRATDYVPSQRIVWAMSGDLQGTIRWYVDPEDDGSRLTYAATYTMPGPALLRPLLKPVVERFNRKELRRLLDNLRVQLEENR
jgi:carbon monoxide dehydrogenase subunit G